MRVLSLVLLLSGLASCADLETCPRPDVIYPCTCKEDDDSGDILVSCENDELKTLARLQKAISGLSGKRNVVLELNGIKLGTVPSDLFSAIEIKKLGLKSCQLDTLTDDGRPVLLGLENSLEELKIHSSFTEENVPARLKLDHMRKLRDLRLSWNTITELGNDWFDSGPASLESLWIDHSFIEKVGNRVFANLNNLKLLAFEIFRIGIIKRSMLPYPAEKLEILYLSRNALMTIPEDLFSNMPALRVIDLSRNGILRLDQRTWHNLWEQLYFIYLDDNPIECDSHMNWMSDVQTTAIITGQCHSPRERKGEDLQRFIKSRSRY